MAVRYQGGKAVPTAVDQGMVRKRIASDIRKAIDNVQQVRNSKQLLDALDDQEVAQFVQAVDLFARLYNKLA